MPPVLPELALVDLPVGEPVHSVALHEPAFELPGVDCAVPPVEGPSALLPTESEVALIPAVVRIVLDSPAFGLVVDEGALVDQSVVLVGVDSLPVGEVVGDTANVVRPVRVDEAAVRCGRDPVDELALEVAPVVEVQFAVAVHGLAHPLPHVDALLLVQVDWRRELDSEIGDG